MQQPTEDRHGSQTPPAITPFTKTRGQRICIGVVLVLLAAGALTLVLSCCWRHEAIPPLRDVTPAASLEGLPRSLRLRLALEADRLRVGSSSAGRWTGSEPYDWELPAREGPWEVTAAGRFLKIDGTATPGQEALFSSEDGIFQLDGRSYRGHLVVKMGPRNSLTAMAVMAPQDYLRGVLPGEMSPDWPLEALMAQAVAARTFALRRMHRAGGGRGYLTRQDMACKGASAESARTDRAVSQTAGIVLTYDGSLLPSYFHTCCGGRTCSAETVFGELPYPPLRGVVCGWCERSPHYHWLASLTAPELAAKLSDWGIGRVDSIEPVEADGSGRFHYMQINRGKKIPAGHFRLAVGPNLLRSTSLRVNRRGGSFEFEGSGWGHGVGMCQWGARGMALAGRTWTEILAHYYPGAEIASIKQD